MEFDWDIRSCFGVEGLYSRGTTVAMTEEWITPLREATGGSSPALGRRLN